MLYLQYKTQGVFYHDYEVRCKKVIISLISTRNIKIGEPIAQVRFVRSQCDPPYWVVLNKDGNGFKVNKMFKSSREMLKALAKSLGTN